GRPRWPRQKVRRRLTVTVRSQRRNAPVRRAWGEGGRPRAAAGRTPFAGAAAVGGFPGGGGGPAPGRGGGQVRRALRREAGRRRRRSRRLTEVSGIGAFPSQGGGRNHYQGSGGSGSTACRPTTSPVAALRSPPNSAPEPRPPDRRPVTIVLASAVARTSLAN